MINDYEQHLKQGDNFANQGKFDDALAAYVEARNADPLRPEARRQIINVTMKKEDFRNTFLEYLDWSARLEESGKTDEAMSVLEEALALENQYEKRGFLRDRKSTGSGKLKNEFQDLSGQFFERLGEIYSAKKDYGKAIDHLLKAVESAPDNTKAHALLGLAYLAKGQLDKAKGPFQEVVRFQGRETPLAYEKLADIYRSQGNTSQMGIWLKDAGDAYVKAEAWEDASRVLENILNSEPGNKEILQRLGEIYLKLNRTGDAVRVYKTLADLYAHVGSFDKVIVIYEKLVELDPDDGEIIDRAIEIYRTSLSVDPGNLRARIKLIENLLRKGAVDEVISEYLRLVGDYERMGLVDEAVNCCEKILEFEPNHGAAREKLAELYLKIGKKEEAGKTYITLAETLQGEGNEDRTLGLIQKAMGLVKEKSQVHLALANDLEKKGKTEEALAEFEKVLERDPDHVEALLKAAQLRMENESWELAEAHLVRLQALNPSQREVKEKLVHLYETQLIRQMEEFSFVPLA